MSIRFEHLPTQYYPEHVGFRPKTPMFPQEMGFGFINGGMGDYICWMQAIRWLATDATWLHGILVGPKFFRELAEYWLKPFPHWKYSEYQTIKDLPNPDKLPLRGPVMLQQESLNATGAHLSTCGWVYFCNKERAPDGWDSYPQFAQADLDAMELPDKAKALEPKKYVVITTGQTTPNRVVPAEGWNHIIEHVRERGLTPVFLGKRLVETGNRANVHTKYSSKLRLDLGVDLLDQTSLLQAASIMSRAAAVVGHDNGLLHLAGCTTAPIVFGYNLASPEHRRPKRPVGETYDVTLSRDELACIHCQSNCNFVIGFVFRQCFYGDNKCIDLLFANRAEKWRKAIDHALEHN